MTTKDQSVENTCVVLLEPNKLQFESRPVPKPKENEVLIAVDSVGICGSDIDFLKNGKNGAVFAQFPIILGHESSGIVEEVGSQVFHLQKGDRVVIEPGVPCRHCDDCMSGHYNLCPDGEFLSTPPCDGSLRRYLTHSADFCFKLPDNVSLEEGALVEPLAVTLYACRRAGVAVGNKVLICGAGSIGLLCLMTSQAFGVSEIAITDIDDKRLEVAKELGATITINVKDKTAQETAKIIEDAFGRPDKCLECTGVDSAINTAILAARRGGVVALIGLGGAEATVAIGHALDGEVDILSVRRYVNCFPDAIKMVSSGKVNLNKLISCRFDLLKSVEAFLAASTRENGVVKVIIHCN